MSAYRTETHVKLTYDAQREDFRRAIRTQRNTAMLRVVTPLLLMTVLVCAGLMFIRLPPQAAALASGGLAFIVALFVAAAWRSSVKFDDSNFDERGSNRLEVSEAAFEIHDRVSGKRIVWELVVHWRETADDFLIYVTPQLFHVIPKRVMPSPEVETAFRRLLEDRVPAGGEEAISAARRRSWIPFVVTISILIIVIGAMLEAAAAVLF